MNKLADQSGVEPLATVMAEAEEKAPLGSPLLQMLLDQQAKAGHSMLPSRIEGIVVGKVHRVAVDGRVRVTFPGTSVDGVPARSMITLTAADEGRIVALMFEASDSTRPLIMGPIVTPALTPEGEPYEAQADGRRLEIQADQEICLRCGDASITLTRDGKVEIQGKYVLSRSSGVNRIQGGAVEVN